MKRIVFVLAVLVLLLPSAFSPARAQNPRIAHSVSHARHDAPMLGRDCWFCLLTNYGAGGSGKYYALYVTSPKVTNVHIHITGGITKTIQVQPFQSAVFNIPLAWEQLASGHVDDFGVHVWSNDADISCYVMSHNPYTSDGMYVIPTIGWGKEYVVAAYAALYEGGGSYVYDEPSEFGIVANQDSTHVSITPTCDLRVESSDKGCCSCLLAAKGSTYNVMLNAGQAVQYKGTCTQDCDNYDLTGTVITSDKPIGLEAGSECPNIPCDSPYCDHVLDYIPPTRTWGNTYYSVPFYQAQLASHTASTFLVITTKPDQVVYRYDAKTKSNVYFNAHKKYDTYWRNDIDQASRWTSDTAFLLVQYINSSTYPDNQNGQGDPAEVVLSPVENYGKSVAFQTPIAIGNQSPYTNYVNIIAKTHDKHVVFDGRSAVGFASFQVDSIYTCYRVTNVKPGGHLLTSDSGAWAYIYGYGWDESYAWPGPMGTATVVSLDTTPPLAVTSGICFTAHVALLDTGLNATGIYYIRVDTINNMGFTLDPNWVEGTAKPTSYYDLLVPDITKPGMLVVSAFDMAGNHTTITSTYTPQAAHVGPPLQDFGVSITDSCTYMYDTLVNTGKTPYPFTTLKLVLGNQGFSIDSAVISPLAVGEKRLIKLCFKLAKGYFACDTLLFGDACMTQEAILAGTGGGPNFRITGHNWGAVLLSQAVPFPSTSPLPIEVVNTSPTQSITIDSMWVDDPIHFVPTMDSHWATGNNPITIPPKGVDAVTITFKTTEPPDVMGPYTTYWCVLSRQLIGPHETGIRCNELSGNVAYLPAILMKDTTITMECVDSTNDTAVVRFVIVSAGTVTSTITKIVHSSPAFLKLTVGRDNGSIVADPSNMSETLSTGQRLFVTDTFVAPLNTDSTYVDTIFAYTLNSDGTLHLIGHVSATIIVKCDAGVEPSSAPPPEQAYLIQTDAHHLRATLPADWPGTVRLELDNVLGVKVLQTAVDQSAIDVSALPTGVYFYRLTDGRKVLTGKIVIDR